jgi:hypothetical protein
MNKINWGRLLLGGFVASIILFLTDGFLHERLVMADWQAVASSLGLRESQHGSGALAYFAIFELGRGFLSIYLYALMRSFCGPGPKTAVWAGIVAGLLLQLPVLLSSSLWDSIPTLCGSRLARSS